MGDAYIDAAGFAPADLLTRPRVTLRGHGKIASIEWSIAVVSGERATARSTAQRTRAADVARGIEQTPGISRVRTGRSSATVQACSGRCRVERTPRRSRAQARRADAAPARTGCARRHPRWARDGRNRNRGQTPRNASERVRRSVQGLRVGVAGLPCSLLPEAHRLLIQLARLEWLSEVPRLLRPVQPTAVDAGWPGRLQARSCSGLLPLQARSEALSNERGTRGGGAVLRCRRVLRAQSQGRGIG